ncbi:MAG TPA: hypothetical protein VNV37_09775, partial [Solirubrobacteraceae bacterium]|nr:hypothetical protein [Solirubrobacteraceae bacterium]
MFDGRREEALSDCSNDERGCSDADQHDDDRDDLELYPKVVDAREEVGGVPSRLMKTEAGDGRQ